MLIQLSVDVTLTLDLDRVEHGAGRDIGFLKAVHAEKIAVETSLVAVDRVGTADISKGTDLGNDLVRRGVDYIDVVGAFGFYVDPIAGQTVEAIMWPRTNLYARQFVAGQRVDDEQNIGCKRLVAGHVELLAIRRTRKTIGARLKRSLPYHFISVEVDRDDMAAGCILMSQIKHSGFCAGTYTPTVADSWNGGNRFHFAVRIVDSVNVNGPVI